MSALAGEPYQPSYVYFGSYRPGATLKPHVDRAQCELSISLLLDYTPEPDGASPWPIHLGAPGAAVPQQTRSRSSGNAARKYSRQSNSVNALPRSAGQMATFRSL